MSALLELLAACLAGLVAAICMTQVEIPFWKKWGVERVAEWQVNSVIVWVLIRKFTQGPAGSSMSVAMHVFHGAALGSLFRVLLDLSQTTTLLPVYPVVYSCLLWIVSPFLTRRSFESAGGFRITRRRLAVSSIAHIIYGIFLVLLILILA
jgi:hypothetical protein